MDKRNIFLKVMLMLYLHDRTINAADDRILAIVGSKQIRPNDDYQVSVVGHGFKNPENFRVSINGTEANGRIFTQTKDVVIQGSSSQNVVFNIKHLHAGRYKLEVRSLFDSSFFDQSVDLNVNSKKHITLVHVDKAIYKPGDVVNFKIILLDLNLKPLLSKVNIFVTDGDDNFVKEFVKVDTVKGVFQNEIQLSDSPVMGRWKLKVKVLNTETDDDSDEVLHFFEVAEYIYPKFEVNVIAKPHITFSDEKVKVQILAKYENGENVKGEVTVSAYPVLWLGSVQPFIQNNIVRKVSRVEDGSTFLDFDIRSELNIIGDFERFVNIEAIFEEDFTGRTQNSSNQVSIHKFNYKLEVVKVSETFKPGLPFYATAKVENFDGTPVNDLNNPVTIYPMFSPKESSNGNFTKYFLNSKGMVDFEVLIPPQATYFNLKAQYLNSDFSLGQIDQSKSLSNHLIQLKSNTRIPKINEEISLEVLATEPMDSITYSVFGKNDLIFSRNLLVSGARSYNFKILTTIAMLPYSYIIVYLIRPNGEILSDKIEIKFQNELPNMLAVDTSSQYAQPGDPLSFTARTKSNSYVGLNAVDEEISKLGKENQLNIEKVYSELFKRNINNNMNGIEHEAIEAFKNTDAFILTNALSEKRLYTPNRDPITIKNDENDEHYSTIRTDIGPPHTFLFKTKPPLAGPYAFSRIPKPRWENPRIYLKKFVKDSWFSEEIISTGYDGRTTLTRKVPYENPQNWKVSGFSVDPIYGLGVNNNLGTIQVNRNFHITTRIPHSMKVGELLSVPITAFNRFNTSLRVEISVKKSDDDFLIINEKDATGLVNSGALSEKKEILIPAASQVTTKFILKFIRAGDKKININAVSNIAVDEIEHNLHVNHEGFPRIMNKKFFIDLRNNQEFKTNVTLSVPNYNVIPQSIKLEASGRSNILGLISEKLEMSTKMLSQKNGEENALAIICHCLLLQSSPEMFGTPDSNERKNLEELLETRYQSQLSFKRNDGAFSMFGKNDKFGNVWLTALTVKALQLSSGIIHIEENVIAKAFEFLANIQSKDGSFENFGETYHKEAEKKIALTAFILSSFLSTRMYEKKHRNTVNKAVDYLVRNLNEINDNYPLALSAYSLQMARHSARDAFFTKLDQKATVKNESKFWENILPTDTKTNGYMESNSLNIETTAFALLTFAESNLFNDAIPVIKWLIEHEPNQVGTSKTSFSDVITLEALLKSFTKINPSRMSMMLKYSDATTTLSDIKGSKYDIPATTKMVEIDSNGQGFGVVHLSYSYNTNVTAEWPRFTLDPQVNRQSTKHFLHLTICTSFVPDNSTSSSNVAVLEVSFPSGFVFDKDTIPFLKATEKIKRVDSKNDDTIAIVYFEYLENREICPVFKAFRIYETAELKPASVVIYDQFDKSRRALQFYRSVKLESCDLCSEKECGELCPVNSRAQKQISNNNSNRNDKIDEIDKLQNSKPNSSHRQTTLSTLIYIWIIFVGLSYVVIY